jgi:hypothetical protein
MVKRPNDKKTEWSKEQMTKRPNGFKRANDKKTESRKTQRQKDRMTKNGTMKRPNTNTPSAQNTTESWFFMFGT